jgi:hypothetical protein
LKAGTRISLDFECQVKYLHSELRASTSDSVETFFIDPRTGAVMGSPDDGAFAFLTRLHTDLHIPSPWGRYLVGLIGIFMLVSLITGIAAGRFVPGILEPLFWGSWLVVIAVAFVVPRVPSSISTLSYGSAAIMAVTAIADLAVSGTRTPTTVGVDLTLLLLAAATVAATVAFPGIVR